MKRNSLRGKSYHRLISRLFFQTTALLFASGLMIALLRKLVRGHLGDFIVAVMMRLGHLDLDTA